MANSHFCLSSNSYKNHVFEGFSRLQQSDEFVDMTLAAGDQFVKVHKTLIALASPYLKALLQAIPCQHPVIFLSNVNHQELHFILEYIYTGEVNIPPEKIESFLDAAQAMHISGLNNIVLPTGNNTNNKPREEKQASEVMPPPLRLYRSNKRFPAVKANITINENDFNLHVEPQVEPQIESQVETNSEIPNFQNNNENYLPLPDFNNEPAPDENIENLNADVAANNITINFDNNYDNANNEIINIDMNNVEIPNNPVPSENFDNIPFVINVLPQNPQQPFLDIGNAAFTVTNTAVNNVKSDIAVDSSNINNPTSFSNLFSIISKPLVAENNDPGKVINNFESGEGNTQHTIVNQEQENETEGANKDKDSILYTISSRGSLQLIMNKFMYYSHYSRDGGKKRRWRCIEYRDTHCPAAIDTEGPNIVARKNKHSHPNHDKKIWNKVVKSRVFTSLRMAQDAVDEKQNLPKLVAEEVLISD